MEPAGHLPVVTVDGKQRAEAVATMQYTVTKVRYLVLSAYLSLRVDVSPVAKAWQSVAKNGQE